MLNQHRRRCEACSAFIEQVTLFTLDLRLAPLEPYSHGAVLPHRRRLPRLARLAPGLAAAVVILGVLGVELPGGHSPDASRTRLPVRLRATDAEMRADVTVLRAGLPNVTPRQLPLPLGQRNARDEF